jgi:hypothetical protein
MAASHGVLHWPRRRLPIAAAALAAVPRSAQPAEPTRDALLFAARLTAAALASELDRQWDRLRALATEIERAPSASPVEMRGLLTRAQRDAPHTVWIGVTNAANGRVLAASHGVLEGEDVSERSWFIAGRNGDFAGDVHSAILLQRALIRDPRSEPLRLIDFTTRVRNAAGQTIRVLGSHVDWQWVVSIIRNAPLPQGAEVALISVGGDVLFGPAGDWLAQPGRYPILPVAQRGDAPRLGWRVVGVPASEMRGRT